MTPACKPRTDDSGVKHVFGETRRDLAEPPVPCDQAAYPTKFPVSDAYLRRLTARIAEGNPKTLSGAFAPDRLCVAMIDTDEFNARALSRFMVVTINRPILEYAASDAEVASVLAHELAHVVMRHDSAVHPELMKDPAGQRITGEAQLLAEQGKRLRAERDQLALDQKAHYERQRARLAAAHPEFARAVRRMDEINAEGLGLAHREPQTFGPPNTPYPSSQLSFLEGEKLEALRREFSKAADVARNLAWKDRLKAERDAESSFFDRSSKLGKSESANFEALADNRRKLEARAVEVLGKDVAANWMEAEADEVGYELYLRAGFVSEGFTWINRVVAQITEVNKTDDGLLSTDEVLDACLKARQDPKAAIARGTGDHPTSCWRLADIRLKEDKDHETEYAPLKAEAKVTSLAGSPTLADAQKEIEQAKATSSPASASPSGAPGP